MHLFGQLAVATSLLATIASTLSVYPHQLAYFNELAGGPENGHKHLLGSNLDWGQDYLYVIRWIESCGLRCDQVALLASSPSAATQVVCHDTAKAETADYVIMSANSILAESERTRLVVWPNARARNRIGFTHWVAARGEQFRISAHE